MHFKCPFSLFLFATSFSKRVFLFSAAFLSFSMAFFLASSCFTSALRCLSSVFCSFSSAFFFLLLSCFFGSFSSSFFLIFCSMRAITWALVSTPADDVLLEARIKGTFKNCVIGERGLYLPIVDEQELGVITTRG